MSLIRSHRELRVYQRARAGAAYVFRLTLKFPAGEKHDATAQFRRCSRSVSANISEAWRKRRYPASFVSKLSDAETEAAEAQTWLDTVFDCGYITEQEHAKGDEMYDHILGELISLMSKADSFASLPHPKKTAPSPHRPTAPSG